MHPLLRNASVSVLATASLLAQGQVGLSFVSGPRPSVAFSSGMLGHGITSVGQVSMIPHPNGTPGLYLGGASVRGLDAALGGRGSWDVVAFTYDRNTDRVTLNNNAAALNTSGYEYALNWGLDGTYAVYDQAAGVYQTLASSPGGPLGPPTPVGGVGTNYADPCPSRVAGATVLFYVDASGYLTWRAHDVVKSSLAGPSTMVSAPAGANQSHSPWPVLGADGDAQALIACEADSSFTASDWNWQGDLDPASPAIAEFPTPVPFESNGCEAGGRVYMPQFTTTFVVYEYDVIALLGDTVPAAGGTVDLTAIAPAKTRTSFPDATIVIMGTSFAAPLALPWSYNSFGLSRTGGFIVIGLIVHDPVTGRGSLTIGTPVLPPMKIPLQGMTVLSSLPVGPYYFTNTSAITVVR